MNIVRILEIETGTEADFAARLRRCIQARSLPDDPPMVTFFAQCAPALLGFIVAHAPVFFNSWRKCCKLWRVKAGNAADFVAELKCLCEQICRAFEALQAAEGPVIKG